MLDSDNSYGTEKIVGLVDVLEYSNKHDIYMSKLADLYGIDIIPRLLWEIWGVIGGNVGVGCD